MKSSGYRSWFEIEPNEEGALVSLSTANRTAVRNLNGASMVEFSGDTGFSKPPGAGFGPHTPSVTGFVGIRFAPANPRPRTIISTKPVDKSLGPTATSLFLACTSMRTVLSCYYDPVVLRHRDRGRIQRAKNKARSQVLSSKPVVHGDSKVRSIGCSNDTCGSSDASWQSAGDASCGPTGPTQYPDQRSISSLLRVDRKWSRQS